MASVAELMNLVETYTAEDGREYLRPVRWEAGLVEVAPNDGHPADECMAGGWDGIDYEFDEADEF